MAGEVLLIKFLIGFLSFLKKSGDFLMEKNFKRRFLGYMYFIIKISVFAVDLCLDCVSFIILSFFAG